jgi:hypothetical protein
MAGYGKRSISIIVAEAADDPDEPSLVDFVPGSSTELHDCVSEWRP